MNICRRLVFRHRKLLHAMMLPAVLLYTALISMPAQADDLYVGRGSYDQIRRYTDQGVQVGAGPFASLTPGSDPQGLTFGPDGNLYVANALSKDVQVFDGQDGHYLRTLSNASFGNLNSIVFDNNGSLFITDYINNKVRKIDNLTGAIQANYDVAGVIGLAVQPNGNLLATSYSDGKVVSIDTTTSVISDFATGLAHAAAIGVGPDGRYYVTRLGDSEVDVVGADGGTASLFATIQGSQQYPYYLAFTEGIMYVTISGAGTVQRFSATGANAGSYLGSFGVDDGNITGITVRPTKKVMVGGTVTLQDCDPTQLAQPLTFEFRPVDNSGNFTRTQTLSATGDFNFTLIPAKNYKVWIKGRKWLATEITVNASGGSLSNLTATLLGGDADNNNLVDFDDLTILAVAYNTAFDDGSGFYDDRADFNCDGQVEFADLTILAINYNLAGDP